MRTLLALVLGTTLVVSALPVHTVHAGPSMAKRTAALVAKLRRQTLGKVEFKDAELKDVVKWLRIATASNFVIKHAALAKADVDLASIRYTISLQDVKVPTFLKVVLEPHDMTAIVKGNVIYITSKADSYGKPVTRMYSISHITYTKTDFIAPTIDLRPSGFVPEDYEPEVVVEDDPLADGDSVAEFLRQFVMPKGWEEHDDWSISATKKYLVVRAPPSVHKLVPRALDMIASMK